MLKLKCPSCGLDEIDAASTTLCSRCGCRLVGSLDDPYDWGLAADAQEEAGRIDAASVEAPLAPAVVVAPAAAVDFGTRMVAWAIDMAAVVIGVIVLGQAYPALIGAMLWPAVFLYFTVCNKLGRSIGKAALGLKVISVDERPIDWPRATLRSVFWLVGLASLGLGLMSITWDEKGQGWHDKVSGTMVVKRGQDREKVSDRIRTLARLRDRGLITDEEFESKKADLLSRS